MPQRLLSAVLLLAVACGGPERRSSEPNNGGGPPGPEPSGGEAEGGEGEGEGEAIDDGPAAGEGEGEEREGPDGTECAGREGTDCCSAEGGCGEGEGEPDPDPEPGPEVVPDQDAVNLVFRTHDDEGTPHLHLMETLTAQRVRHAQQTGELPPSVELEGCERCWISPDSAYATWIESDVDSGATRLMIAPVADGWQVRADLARLVAQGVSLRPPVFAGGWLLYISQTPEQPDAARAQQADDGSQDHVVSQVGRGGQIVGGADEAALALIRVTPPAELSVHAADARGGGAPTLLHTFEVAELEEDEGHFTGGEPSAVSPDGSHVAVITSASPTRGATGELLLNIIAMRPRAPGDGLVESHRRGGR